VATHLSAQSASHATTAAKPTIVLVHGAWADASGWYDVTLALHARYAFSTLPTSWKLPTGEPDRG